MKTGEMKVASLAVRRKRTTYLAMLGAFVLVLAAYGTSTSARAASKPPVTIGVSVSLSGDFSGDGQAILQGYRIWANYVNAHGGLLGRPVKLVIKNDNSTTQQTQTNYATLIGTDHVNLVVGPFSSLLTIPAESMARRYGYLLLGPAGGAPSVFAENYSGYAFVQPASVVDNLVSFGNMLKAMPASQRPKTVAYATSNDPFTYPQLNPLRSMLTKAGIKSLYYTMFPDETPDLQPEALAIVRTHAQAVVLGTTSVPQVQAFVQTFIQQHYTPKIIIATAGPDQGTAFSKAIGMKNTEGFLVPSGWTPTANNYQNSLFVQMYLKAYHGSAGAIPSDAPEAFSVGQVLQQLVGMTHSLNNATLIRALHSGHVFQTAQGGMSFSRNGVPLGGGTFLVQWQKGATKIVWPMNIAQSKLQYPKPTW